MKKDYELGDEEEKEYLRSQLFKIEKEMASLEAEKRRVLNRIGPSLTTKSRPDNSSKIIRDSHPTSMHIRQSRTIEAVESAPPDVQSY